MLIKVLSIFLYFVSLSESFKNSTYLDSNEEIIKSNFDYVVNSINLSNQNSSYTVYMKLIKNSLTKQTYVQFYAHKRGEISSNSIIMDLTTFEFINIYKFLMINLSLRDTEITADIKTNAPYKLVVTKVPNPFYVEINKKLHTNIYSDNIVLDWYEFKSFKTFSSNIIKPLYD